MWGTGYHRLRLTWGRATAHALLSAFLLLLAGSLALAADPLPEPQGPVILVVTGNISVKNSDKGAEFDRDMLYALGPTEIRTTTTWTDGVQVFEGVLARKVFERVGAQGTTVMATALNDYTAPIPMEDFQNYDVLLAMKMNGEEMKVSDKGPIWIVYPRDDQPVLQDTLYNERWVWQLKGLGVE